jgi:hypothetical protein
MGFCRLLGRVLHVRRREGAEERREAYVEIEKRSHTVVLDRSRIGWSSLKLHLRKHSTKVRSQCILRILNARRRRTTVDRLFKCSIF